MENSEQYYTSWPHQQNEYVTNSDGEKINLVTVDSWFVKLSEKLKFKCFKELAAVKFHPDLNLKSTAEAEEDI